LADHERPSGDPDTTLLTHSRRTSSRPAGDELSRTQEALRRSDERVQRVLEGIADGLLVVDRRWRITYLNRSAEQIIAPLGKSGDGILGKDLWSEFPHLVGTVFEEAYRKAQAEGASAELESFFAPLDAWFAVRAYPSAEGLSIFFQDVTRRKDAEARLASERAILEMIADAAPLESILRRLAVEAERQSTDGMLCSILLLDEAGQRLLHGAAPSLPAPYNAAIHGVSIGPSVGSCGTAAYRRSRVCVADIDTDPLWANFRAVASPHGLRACTSTPVLARDGRVLATVAMYYPVAREPSARDESVIALTTRLAGIAIERKRAEDALRRSEQFSRGVIENTRDCIKTLTLEGVLTWISESGRRLLCIDDASHVLGKSWLDFWEGEDREKAVAAVRTAAGGGAGSFVGYFPVSGEPRWWDVVVTPIRDAAGNPETLLAVSRDMTERVLADRQLRASEAGLRQLANLIPQLAWMAEPDGHIFWYNEGWYRYTGTTPEAMQGWGWQSVHDPQVLPKVVERWRESLRTGETFEMEFPLRGADGSFRWFLTRVNPMRDSEGRVVRWFGTNTDVDQVRRIRHALEEETRTLELLNRSGAALSSNLDLQALLQSVTDSATQLSGAQFGAFFYNIVDANGEAFQLYTLSGAPREAFEKFGHPRATPVFGPTFRGEGVIRSDDITRDPRYGQCAPHHGMPEGHLPVRSYLAVPVVARSGEVLGGLFFGHSACGVFTERSERLVQGVAAQAAVAIDNARLYEAAQRAAEERKLLLESERHARAAAERVSRMKDEFLATLSHELRTPLSAILGWANVLRMKGVEDPDVRKALDTIERNARTQTQLIEDLLDMSRITSGKLRLDVQALQPVSLVEAAVESVRPAACAKGIRLERVLDPLAGPVMGDPARLQQVVWNLLNNAIKFTPKGGKVHVSLARVNSHIEICVADTGVGIEPEFLDHVFERFRQADASTTRQYGGLGLGLAIVKHLVELHGGTVQAHSEGEGRGSRFVVHLPLAAVHADDRERREHPRSAQGPALDFRAVDLSGVKVLVVDDEPDARELLARVLGDCRATVLAAASAVEALKIVSAERPHVLVSDIGMPEVDGYELLRRVRALGEEGGGRIPAIALTAFARSEDRTRALQRGFQVHVAKPVEPAELAATVASVAGRTMDGIAWS
jgi:PAS domain S-box-containing protein